MIIDCIADLHGYYPKLEGGDLLIVAGDLTARDTKKEYQDFHYWLSEQNYEEKIVISGNHDTFILHNKKWFIDELQQVSKSRYLFDSGTEFQGLKIYGSPWTKTFPGMNPKCKAFTCDTEEELCEKWELIPHDVDILITHSPPFSILDEIPSKIIGNHVGSRSLYSSLKYVFRPYLHVFGHIHESYGTEEIFACRDYKVMKSVNCSHVNEYYQPVNKPVRVIL